MGIFGKPSSKPQAVKTDLINNIRANESVRGKIPPVSLGTNRLKMFLLWAGDFLKTDHTTTQHVPGGLFGSGGGDVNNVTTTYSTAFLAGLALGTQNHIANLWDSAGKAQAIQVTENFTIPPGGGTFVPTAPGGNQGNRGVSRAQSFSAVVNDFGSAGSRTLSGSFQQPMTQVASSPGAGQYVVNTGGTYTFSGADAGATVPITYTANFATVTELEETTIPGGLTVQVPNSTLYVADGGVQFVNPTTFAQTPAVKVTLSPAAGQYTVNSSGLYTFNSADIGKIIRITWQQSDPNTTGAAATFNFSFTPGTEGQAPWSYLTAHHPDQAVGYSGMSTIQSSSIQLGSSGEMPQITFETIGPWTLGDGNLDCNPNDVIYAYLTDHIFGIDFPVGNLEFGPTTATRQTGGVYLFIPAANNQGGNAAAFWAANGFFVSPLIENQTSVSSEMARILEAGQTAVVWSEGLLKLRPYGDTSIAANGAIYQPLTQPVVDLDDGDYVAAAGTDPIKVTRAAWNGIYNRVQIQYQDRNAGYNPEVIMEDDLASVQANGLHTESPQQWDFIKSPSSAQWAANLRVKRLANIRNSYEFTIPCVYDNLEPMDLVTLTSPGMGFNKKPVRIIKIEDDPINGLLITAEDFPYGIAKATLYPKQTTLSTTESPALAEPGNSEPLILELPDKFTNFAGYTYRIYAAPDTPGRWGGCDVYLSSDNVEFTQAGTIKSTPAITGILNGTLAAGTGDPDTTSSVSITLTSTIQLPAISQTDFDALNENSLLAIIDAGGGFEIVAYRDVTLTGVNTYTVSHFHRGLFGTTRAAHTSGAKVVKMDQGHLEISYPPSLVGTTQHVKLASFNTFGKMAQDVNVVASNAFTLTGAFPGIFDKTSGIVFLNNTSPAVVLGAVTGAQKNLVPDSDLRFATQYWSVGPNFSIQPGIGMGGSNAFQMIGTGSALGFGTSVSPRMTLPAGTYTFSGYIDATAVTSGNPVWSIENPTFTTSFSTLNLPPGQKGRISNTFTLVSPTTVVIFCDQENCTATSGGKIIWSNPQLEVGSVMTAYQPDAIDTGRIGNTSNQNLVFNPDFSIYTTPNGLISQYASTARTDDKDNAGGQRQSANGWTRNFENVGGDGVCYRSDFSSFGFSPAGSYGMLLQEAQGQAAGARFSCVSDAFPVSPGKQYRVSAQVDTIGGLPTHAVWYFRVVFYKASTTDFSRTSGTLCTGTAQATSAGFLNGAGFNTTGGAGFVDIASGTVVSGLSNPASIVTPPSDAAYARIAFYHWTDGTAPASVWNLAFGDVHFDVMADPGVVSDNLIKNPDYALGTFNWHLNESTGTGRFVSATDYPRGTTSFQADSVPLVLVRANEYIPVDVTKTYFMEAWIKIPSPGSNCLLGFTEYDGNQALLTRSGAFAYCLTPSGISSTTGNTWQYFAAEVTGNSASPSFTQFLNTAKYIRPMALLNWSGSSSNQPVQVLGWRWSEVAAGNIRALKLLQKGVSSDLNLQASVLPGQGVSFTKAAETSSTIGFSWGTQSFTFPDTSTFTLSAGSQNFSGLTASHTYYVYIYLSGATTGTATMNMSISSSPSLSLLAATYQDQRISLGFITDSTTASGVTGGGGSTGDSCPHEDEPVYVLRDNAEMQVAAKEVRPGDLIRGYSFAEQKDVYRSVLHIRHAKTTMWYRVQGHLCSPCEQVFVDGQWYPAFKAPGAERVRGVLADRIEISVEADSHDEKNYYLAADTPLLIHNFVLPRS